MRTLVVKGLLLLTFCAASAAMHIGALANDWPMIPGDFYEVTGIKLKDGGATQISWLRSGEPTRSSPSPRAGSSPT